jgi:F-type H+-transporting ATPase subunit gamma
MERFIAGEIDRVDVAYTKIHQQFETRSCRRNATSVGWLGYSNSSDNVRRQMKNRADYEFLPSAESILEEVVPASFRVKLFKCFLDAAVSEQIARMVAMKGATENAGEMIGQLSMTFNRARQARITREIMEIIGGVEALEG